MGGPFKYSDPLLTLVLWWLVTGPSVGDSVTDLGDIPHSTRHTPASLYEDIAEGLHFVIFYRTWSGHDKAALQHWRSLAEKYSTNNDDNPVVHLGHFDCTDEENFCRELDATGYPTYKFFLDGEDMRQNTDGLRNEEKLTAIIQDAQQRALNEPVAPLSSSEFYAITHEADASGILILFYYRCHDMDVAEMVRRLSTRIIPRNTGHSLENTPHRVLRVNCSKNDVFDVCENIRRETSLPAVGLYGYGRRIAVHSLFDYIDFSKLTYNMEVKLDTAATRGRDEL